MHIDRQPGTLGEHPVERTTGESTLNPPSVVIFFPSILLRRFLNLGEMMNLGGLDGSMTTLGGRVKLTGKAAGLARRAVYAVSFYSCFFYKYTNKIQYLRVFRYILGRGF